MKKDRTAQMVTAAVILAVLAFLVIRQTGWSPSTGGAGRDETPQDAIYAMLDAARDGEVDDYVEFYTGQIRATLDQAIAEKGKRGFAEYLRESNEPIKGIAITEPEALSASAVKARVEYVFADRNEVQIMYLEKTSGRWLITGMDATQRIKTLVPYGTPVQ
jgi:hypothetical protein